jgi:hypothetical protein
VRHVVTKGRRDVRRGQSLVEFALIVPVMLAFILVIIELGVVLTVYVGLTNTAREVARAGAMFIYDPALSPGATPAIATVDSARAAVMNQALVDTLSPLIDQTGLNAAETRYSYLPAVPVSNYRYGDRLSVTLSYEHDLFFGILGQEITLRANSDMRLEPGGR